MATAGGSGGRSTFSPFDALVFVALASTWGFSFLFIKVALDQLSPWWIVSGRTLVGSIVLLAILRFRGRWLPTGLAAWGHLLVLASLGNAFPWAMVAWAEESIPSGLAAVVNSLAPLSTLVVAAAVGQERLTGTRLLGLGLALTGTVVAVWEELGAAGQVLAVAAVWLATLMYASAGVYAKHFVSGRYRPLQIAAGQVLVAGLLSLPIALVVGPVPAFGELRVGVVTSVLLLGVAGTGLAFLLFYVLIERVGATSAVMVTYLIPVVGLSAGWLLLDEHVGPQVLVGAAVIIVGIWLGQRRPAAEARRALEAAGTPGS